MVVLLTMGVRHRVGVKKRKVSRSENVAAKRLDIFRIGELER